MLATPFLGAFFYAQRRSNMNNKLPSNEGCVKKITDFYTKVCKKVCKT